MTCYEPALLLLKLLRADFTGFCSSCLGGWLKRPGDKLPRQAATCPGQFKKTQAVKIGNAKIGIPFFPSLVASRNLD